MKKIRVWLALQFIKIFLFWYVIAVWLSPALAIGAIIELVEGMKSIADEISKKGQDK